MSNATIDNLDVKIGDIVIHHRWFKGALNRIDRCYSGARAKADLRGVALLGDSGTGKSHLVEYFETMHPRERTADGLRVPVLRIKSPENPTVKGLVTELLFGLEDPLYDKGTEHIKTLRLRKLLKSAGTVLIILDEFQHFVDKASHKIKHQVADWLKVQVEETGVGLVVAGLPRLGEVMAVNEQFRRRFRAETRLPRFDWRKGEHRKQFRLVLHGMQHALAPLSLPDLSSEEMAYRCYCATGGLFGHLANLLKEVVENAKESGRLEVTLEDLDRASRDASFDLPLGIEAAFSREFDTVPNEKTIQEALSINQTGAEPDET